MLDFIIDIVFVIFGSGTPKGNLNRRAKFLYGFLLGLIAVLFIFGIYLAINGKIGITSLTTLV
jgi:hypothetical protein